MSGHSRTLRVFGTLFVCAFLGSSSVCHAILTCVTTSSSYQAPAGCYVDKNNDGFKEHIDNCTVTIYTKTCTSETGFRYVTKWLTAGIPVQFGDPKKERFANLENSPGWLFKPADGIAFLQPAPTRTPAVQAPPQSSNARLRVPATALPTAATSATDGRSSTARPDPGLRTLRCETGYATIYDAAGAALEPVGPCFGGEWTASTR